MFSLSNLSTMANGWSLNRDTKWIVPKAPIEKTLKRPWENVDIKLQIFFFMFQNNQLSLPWHHMGVMASQVTSVRGNSVCWPFGASDFQGSNPAFGRITPLAFFRFETTYLCQSTIKTEQQICISPEPGMNQFRQWSQVGAMLQMHTHRDGLLSSSLSLDPR